MKVLLIGGTGIISKDVCRVSLERGYDVTVLNRGRNRAHLLPGAKLIIGDVRNESIDELKIKLDDRYDVVVDFISYNCEQLKKTMRLIVNRCQQYIFISSATVYSKILQANEKFVESDPIDNPYWQYTIDKSICEHWLEDHKAKINYTIVRPYVTYGETRIPFQINTGDYYTLLNRIICDKPILTSGAKRICSLTYAYDFSIGLVGLFLNEKAYNEAFHITTDEELTWEKCIKIIGQKFNKEIRIVDIPLENLKRYTCPILNIEELTADKGRNNRFDNSKIKRAVPDFNANTLFEQGVENAINYYLNNKKINYSWDAQIDYIIGAYLKEKEEKANIYLNSYQTKLTHKEKWTYLVNRYYSFHICNFNYWKKQTGN